MTFTLRQLAEIVSGELHGDGELVLTGANIIRDARAGEITLAEGDKALKQLETCAASAVIAGKLSSPPQLPYIQVENLHAAFAKVVVAFHPRRELQRTGIHPGAHVDPSARLGANIEIHPGATIGPGVVIGDDCTIHAHVTVMHDCRIGAGTTLFPSAVLYENTIVGQRCLIHAHAVLGAYGFGYATTNGQHKLSPQLGHVELADDVEIGAGTTIDRGTYGATTIGSGTKIDNSVQIGHNCQIGQHNLICALAGIAGSSSTGDYVVIAGQVGIRDHVHIATGVLIGAQAGILHDMLVPGAYIGTPAMPDREHFACLHGFNKLPEMRKQMKQLARDVEQLKQHYAGDASKIQADSSPIKAA